MADSQSMPDQCCRKCGFFQPDDCNEDVAWDAPVSGSCHRHAPQPVTEVIHRHYNSSADLGTSIGKPVWPSVDPRDWCGEYRSVHLG